MSSLEENGGYQNVGAKFTDNQPTLLLFTDANRFFVMYMQSNFKSTNFCNRKSMQSQATENGIEVRNSRETLFSLEAMVVSLGFLSPTKAQV